MILARAHKDIQFTKNSIKFLFMCINKVVALTKLDYKYIDKFKQFKKIL